MKWFEILSLGLDAITYSEMHKTRQQVEGMNNSEMLKALEEEILNSLKNLIFASLKSAEAMQQYVETAPQKVFVGSTLLEWRLKSFNISPDIFKQFDEKEYTKKTQDAISNLTKHSRQSLTSEEVQEGETCVQYILEMPELNKAIETEKENDVIRQSQATVTSIQEELKQTDPEWEPLSKSVNRNKLLGLAAAFLSPVLFCCCGSYFTFPLIGASDSTAAIGVILSLLLTIGTGITFIGGLIFIFRKPPERYAELKKIRDEINSRRPKTREITPLAEKFSVMNTEKLLDLRNSRQQYINKVLGDVDQDYNYDMIFLEN